MSTLHSLFEAHGQGRARVERYRAAAAQAAAEQARRAAVGDEGAVATPEMASAAQRTAVLTPW